MHEVWRHILLLTTDPRPTSMDGSLRKGALMRCMAYALRRYGVISICTGVLHRDKAQD